MLNLLWRLWTSMSVGQPTRALQGYRAGWASLLDAGAPLSEDIIDLSFKDTRAELARIRSRLGDAPVGAEDIYNEARTTVGRSLQWMLAHGSPEFRGLDDEGKAQ